MLKTFYRDVLSRCCKGFLFEGRLFYVIVALKKSATKIFWSLRCILNNHEIKCAVLPLIKNLNEVDEAFFIQPAGLVYCNNLKTFRKIVKHLYLFRKNGKQKTDGELNPLLGVSGVSKSPICRNIRSRTRLRMHPSLNLRKPMP